MSKYDDYLKAKRKTKEALEWDSKKDSIDSQNHKHFSTSIAHSSIKLMYCGQHSTGGHNYWESPECLNNAILKVIYEDYETIIKKALIKLESEEIEALKECREYAEDILKDINSLG